MPTALPTSTRGGRFLSARRSTLAISIGAIAAIALAACGSTAASSAGTTTTTYGNAGYGASPSHPSPAEQAATLAATAGFRRYLVTSAESFSADVSQLATDAKAGDVTVARRDELAAQAAYDALRASIQPDSATANQLDGESWSIGSGTFQGLHAIEHDLWDGAGTTGVASTATALLGSTATVTFLFFRTILTPQQIVSEAQTALAWTVDVPVQLREELYSHDNLLDVAATVGAARASFALVEPLGRTVDPATTSLVSSRFATLDGLLSSLGNPLSRGDGSVSGATWRQLAVAIDAVDAPLGTLGGNLAGFGSGRLYA